MAVTRADLTARLAQLDEEREQTRDSLDRLDQVLARLAAQLERAREPEEQYTATHQRLQGELHHLMATHDLRVIDNSAAHVSVFANTRPVPRDVERRVVELCRALRQLEVDRADYLRNGGVTVAGATQRLEEARIARVRLAARLAELGG